MPFQSSCESRALMSLKLLLVVDKKKLSNNIIDAFLCIMMISTMVDPSMILIRIMT